MNFEKESKNQETTKKCMLVIEDEKFWVDLFKLQLHRIYPNIAIVHAENGEEAVKYIKESQKISTETSKSSKPKGKTYDAIITDIRMPVMDGCTAVRIIRDLLYTGPILVWSSYRNSSEDLKRALDIPVNGFCVKEGNIENIIVHLRNLNVIT